MASLEVMFHKFPPYPTWNLLLLRAIVSFQHKLHFWCLSPAQHHTKYAWKFGSGQREIYYTVHISKSRFLSLRQARKAFLSTGLYSNCTTSFQREIFLWSYHVLPQATLKISFIGIFPLFYSCIWELAWYKKNILFRFPDLWFPLITSWERNAFPVWHLKRKSIVFCEIASWFPTCYFTPSEQGAVKCPSALCHIILDPYSCGCEPKGYHPAGTASTRDRMF